MAAVTEQNMTIEGSILKLLLGQDNFLGAAKGVRQKESGKRSLAKIWELETVAGNRVAAINPPMIRRCGPDAEIQHGHRNPHKLAESSRILSTREADTEIQYRPHIFDTDTIVDAIFADAVFADAISETSKKATKN